MVNIFGDNYVATFVVKQNFLIEFFMHSYIDYPQSHWPKNKSLLKINLFSPGKVNENSNNNFSKIIRYAQNQKSKE